MNNHRIDLHIAELVLRDLPYAERDPIAAALEQELYRLLSEQGLPKSLAGGGTIPEITIDDLDVAGGTKPDAIGTQLAQQVYGSLDANGRMP